MAKRNTRRPKLSELFIWKKPLVIRDIDGDEVLTVYQRVVNDKDMEQARLEAIRTSHQTRLALRDSETPQYAALMENIASFGQEEFISILLLNDLERIQEEARKEVRTNFPKHPGSDATLEDIENYEAAIDEYDSKVQDEFSKQVSEISKKYRDRYAAKSEEELIELATKAMENQICRNVMAANFDERLAYFATYKDDKYQIKYFSSFDEFEELASEVKKQLVQGYQELLLSREDLKN